MKLTYRDRGIPRRWRNKHWGANGEIDWGEPAWPGWAKPVKFWESKWPAVIIAVIWAVGWLMIPLFLWGVYTSR